MVKRIVAGRMEEGCEHHRQWMRKKGFFLLVFGALLLLDGLGYIHAGWEALVGLALAAWGLKKLAWSMKEG